MRTTLLLLALAASAAPAFAQMEPTSVRLNQPALANQYLSVTSKTDLQGHDAYTLEAWVKPAVSGNAMAILGNDWTTSWWFGLNASGRLLFYPRGGVGVLGRQVLPLGEWTHVAATYASTTGWALYVNGQPDTSSANVLGSPGTNAGDLRIGADRSAGTPAHFWRGALDEVRVWSEARSAAQIRETMFQGVGRPHLHSSLYAACRANWDMQQPDLTTCFDRASGAGALTSHATMVNGDYWALSSTDAPPVALNVGVWFNGVDNYGVLLMGDGFASGLTIEAWVCPHSFANLPTIAGRGFQTSFWLGLNHAGQVRFYPTGGVGNFVESVQALQLDRFTHVAATYSDGLTCLYLNGDLVKAARTITGPVGENGRWVWVGADNSGVGPQYEFDGILDEVRVTRGARSRTQILGGMFAGFSGFTSPMTVLDENGASCVRHHANLDGYQALDVYGTDARVVRSSAPMLDATNVLLSLTNPAACTDAIFGGAGLLPPETFNTVSIGTDLYVPLNRVITDLEVFVSAQTTDLAGVSVRLRSPLGTERLLIAAGAARGRDLHTVFEDDAAATLATGDPPYVHGVRPSDALSDFDGQNSQGYWRLSLLGSGAARVALNAWAIQVNDLTLDAPGSEPAVMLSAENPVHGQGRAMLTLPRAARVTLALHDTQGRRVRELLSGERGPGMQAVSWNAQGLPPGLYLLRLALDGETAAVEKVTVLR